MSEQAKTVTPIPRLTSQKVQLGPRGLQLYLVREAQQTIMQYAVGILDRLSAGQLGPQLKQDDDNSRALQLEAFNRQTGEAPINVAFLSGSQKFRVAVSLALAIGQYASRQHRPI